MNCVKFSVYGEPKAKGRPRFAKRGNFVKTYTPEETLNYEAFIKMRYLEAANGTIFDGAVEAEINCVFGIPKSTSKKKKQEMLDGHIPCMKRPDTDNIAKSILDSINTIAYKDDSQVVKLTVTKMYGEIPRVDVIIKDWEKKKCLTRLKRLISLRRNTI